MAWVYEVSAPDSKEHRAVKLVRTADPTPTAVDLAEMVRRMRTEFEACRRLDHPNIIRVSDMRGDGAGTHIVMEYVAGENLQDKLQARIPLPWKQAKAITLQLLAALAHAHGRGVVHRDIKPGNLLLTPEGQIKLLDFGTAWIENSDSPSQDQLQHDGTLRYMSPEQVTMPSTDRRSDLWSAAVMLYEILTGAPLFDGDETSILQKILYENPAPPSSLNKRIPDGVDALIQKALNRHRESRFQSAAEFAEAIKKIGRCPNRRCLLLALGLAGAAGTAGTAYSFLKPVPCEPENPRRRPECPQPPPPPTETECIEALTEGLKKIPIISSTPIVKQGAMGVPGGPAGLTYFQMANDLAGIAAAKGLSIRPLETNGTLSNINLIAGPQNAGIGFVQSDVLQFIGRSADGALRKNADALRLVMALHSEEVHILANKHIPARAGLAGLAGKLVLTAKNSEGSFVTASNLLLAAGVEPKVLSAEFEAVQAVAKVITGEASAMFITTGQPARLLRAFDALPERAKAQIYLMPLKLAPDQAPPPGYERAVIQSYAWQGDAVDTLSVRALLVAYDFYGKTGANSQQRCLEIAKLVKIIQRELWQLRQLPNHPQWGNVDPNRVVSGWRPNLCK